MLSQNKKIIGYLVITLVIILLMVGLTFIMVRYLANTLKSSLSYKSSIETITKFDFDSLKNLNISEINDLLANISNISTSENPANLPLLESTSTEATSSSSLIASSTNSTSTVSGKNF
jgi:predicted PurR-regulated permease PerM